MKITKGEFSGVHESLLYLSKTETKAWYGTGKNLRKMLPVLTSNEEDRKAIIDKLAEKDEDGKTKTRVENGIEVLDFSNKETEAECMKALEDWSKETVEFEFHHINPELLQDEKLPNVLMDRLYGNVFPE